MTDDKAAELLAAVRAVESGERPAASFFTESAPPPARKRPTPGPTPAPGPVEARGGEIRVPEEVRAVLSAGGAPESLAVPVAEALGEQAGEVLRADPWQLLAVASVRPEQADLFARSLLGEETGPEDARRAQALAVHLLERAALRGSTVLGPDVLARGLARYGVPDPDTAVREAVEAGALLVFEDPDPAASPAPGTEEGEEAAEPPVRLLMGLERHAVAEETLADGLARLAATFTAPADPAAWEEAAAQAPSPSAAELIRACAGHGLVVHTGGEAARAEPAALVTAARAAGLSVRIAAHTPDGRERMDRLVQPPSGEEAERAVTVSGLLAGREGPERTGDGTWPLDLLIVCDAAQLDTETAAALTESLPDGARLVLSGDPLLLGPPGSGRVFTDLTASRFCPLVVSRTPDPGPVGELVSGIGIGELNTVDAPGHEVVIVPVQDAAGAVLRTVQLITDSVPRAIGVPSEHTQVITPGHGGAAGTRALNSALKERLNPGPGRFGGFDPGDRITWSPSPGHTLTGTVVSADDAGLRLDCPGAGAPVVVPPERVAGTVRHGWAVTAHQAMGTRWPAAVVVLPGDAADELTREWVYSAFSRGEQHLSVVHGAGDALPRAVASRTAPVPCTRLRTLLAQAARAAAEDGEGASV